MNLKKCFTGKNLLLLFAVILIAAILVLLGLRLLSPKPYELTTFSMGSYVQQTVGGTGGEGAALSAAQAVTDLENKISWRIEGSDIAALNNAQPGEAVSLSPETIAILETALSVCRESGGAFDVTIAPLSRLWDFDGTPALPSQEEIQSLLPLVDYTSLSLSESTASLSKEGMAVDLGAVGKGAACDAVIQIYRDSPDVSYGLVAVGGSIGTYGKKPGNAPWKISVRDPKSQGSLGILETEGGFFSTSGSYEKTFTDETTGKTYHHLLDPSTGYPGESGLVSVTIQTESGALSDALSTACFLLGMEKSLPLLETFQAQAVFVTTEDEIYVTDGLAETFTLTNTQYTVNQL